jgi:cyclic pyranopterin phosphate synthase
MNRETYDRILAGGIEKGDPLQVARIAGINAAKRTSELIPLCHPIAVTNVEVQCQPQAVDRIVVTAKVSAIDRTGAEMEALTAVSAACLCIYDMCKPYDKMMVIENVMLLEKSGGKSGHFKRA